MQSICLTGGLRLGVLGTAADLDVAAPLLADPYSAAAETDASRIGLYFNRTVASERIGFVVMGTEVVQMTALDVKFLVMPTLPAQAANTIYAGPTAGGALPPTFRAMVAADLPTVVGLVPGAYTKADITVDAYGRVTAAANGAASITGSGVAGQVTYWTGAMAIGGSTSFTFNPMQGSLALAQVVQAASTPSPILSVTGAANTTNIASVEVVDIDFNMAQIKQWATGALTTQRSVLVRAPTYSFVGPSTITTAATFAITGEPQPGPNAVITNGYALWVQSGGSRLDQGTITSTGYKPALAITSTWNIGANTNALIQAELVDTASSANSALMALKYGTGATTNVFFVKKNGGLSITQAVVDSSHTAAIAMSVQGGNHTNMTAGQEVNVVQLQPGASSIIWNTGALGTQRAIALGRCLISFNAASTVTSSAAVAIRGPNLPGANCTITNSYALWVQAGTLALGSKSTDSIGGGQAGDLRFNNATNDFDITIQSGATSASYSLTLPTAQGAASTLLSNDGAGVLSWVPTPLPALTATYIGYGSGANLLTGSNKLTWDNVQGAMTLTQVAVNGTASAPMLTLIGAGNTAQTAGTETIDVDFKLDRTVQWATGALTTQRAFLVRAPTYAFVGASALTTAATFAIEGAPVAGTNATIANPLALWVESGASRLSQGTITTSTLPALSVQSTWNNAGVTFTGLQVAVTRTAASVSSLAFAVNVNTADLFLIRGNGSLYSGPAAQSSTLPSVSARFDSPNHLNMTASTEYTAFLFYCDTQEWATGALATQRFFRIVAPTYAFVGGSTITTAATFSIDNAPIPGLNAGITTPLALWVQAGASRFDQGTPITAGLPALTVTSTFNSAANYVGMSVDITNTNSTASSTEMFRVRNGSTSVLSAHVAGAWINGVVLDAQSTSSLYLFKATGAAHTNIAAQTEINTVLFSLTQVRQWSTGDFATQREFLITAPTYSFVGVSTITTAATLAVSGAPSPGPNANITNAYALWVQAGMTCLDRGTVTNTLVNNALKVTATYNTAGNAATMFLLQYTDTASTGSSKLMDLQLNASPVFSVLKSGALAINQAIVNASYPLCKAFQVTAGAHTNIPTHEATLFEVGGSSLNWVAGSFAYQRTIYFDSVLLSFASASTITTAATVAIRKANTAGANCTITNNYTLWLESGILALGSKSTDVGGNQACPLQFNNATNDFHVTIQSGATSATYALTLPLAQGGAGSVLSNDGTGVLSWASNPAALTATYVGFGSAGNVLTGSTRLTWDDTYGSLAVTQAAASGTSKNILTVTGAALSALTTGTEFIDVYVNLNRTVAWTGSTTITTQRAVYIQAPTYSAAVATTMTTGATLAISGAPATAASMTITNPRSLLVEAGISEFKGLLITAAPVTGSAGFRLTPGTLPTTLVSGDVWMTTTGVFGRVNGATIPLSVAINALTDAATIAVDASLGTQHVVTLTASRNMGAPTNAADGMMIMFEIIQGGAGSFTITWNAIYQFSAAMPAPVLSTAVGAKDYVAFRYDSASAKWHCLSYALGYT